ncbi:MAG: hypothetical protein ABWZ66_03850 [Pyrinomonadaceae bacterium]
MTKKDTKQKLTAPAALPSDRQILTKTTRDEATTHQTVTGSTTGQPRYDVPYGLTPDEDNFKKYAASFHKLLEHDPVTGLLTDSDPGNPKSGVDNYKLLLEGLQIETPNSDFSQDAFNQIELAYTPPSRRGPKRVIINPQSSKSLTIKGGDIAAFKFKTKNIENPAWENGYEVVYAEPDNTPALLAELSLSSGYSAAEMVEVYAMALLRDVPFANYNTLTPDIQLAIDALNEFENDFRGPKEQQPDGTFKVTWRTLFRGNSPKSLRGDYLSKFLYPLRRPPLFASGCAPGTATLSNSEIFFDDFAQYYLVPPPNPRRAFGLTWGDYVAIQNGTLPLPDVYHEEDFLKPETTVRDGLTLGSLVHTDGLYQEYVWAADILTAGNYRRSPVSIYTTPPPIFRGPYARNEGDGPTLGPPDAAGLIGAVAIEAARLAWSVKYLVARRARPEVFAALIHKRLNGGTATEYGNIDPRLLTPGTKVRQLLNRIKTQNTQYIRYSDSRGDQNTYLLSQLFPEASPAHPSWVSGHATIAGACVTVIKAIFDDTSPLLQQVNVTPPPPFVDENGAALTVGGELDKLASNVAHGRNFAGVHYRSDGEHGIQLGEELAIRFLQDHLRTYRELFRCDTSPEGTKPCFVLTKRNGQRIKITANSVLSISGISSSKTAEAVSADDSTSDKFLV